VLPVAGDRSPGRRWTKGITTPNATCFQQFNFSSEEFLNMLRFDQHSWFEELQEKIDRTGKMVNIRLLQFYNVVKCVTVQAAASST
jgi:hypothetical protein